MRKEDITPKVIELIRKLWNEYAIKFDMYEGSRFVSGEYDNTIYVNCEEPDGRWRFNNEQFECCDTLPIPDFLDCVRWLGEKRIIFDMLDTNDGEYNLMMMEKDPISVQLIRFYDENCQYDALLEGILSCVLEVARREK
jgi:hypothetical protein